MKKLAVLIVGSIALCGYINSSFVLAVELSQPEMIGLSKQALLKCFGTPIGQEQIDDLEFLTYGGQVEKTTNGTGNTENIVDSSTHVPCRATTFVLKNGLVQHIYSPGRSENASENGGNCVFNIEKCK